MRIRSTDPRDPPSIIFDYLTTESDRQDMRDAVRFSRETAPASALGQRLERKNDRTPSVPTPISTKSAPQFTRTVTKNARRKEVLPDL